MAADVGLSRLHAGGLIAIAATLTRIELVLVQLVAALRERSVRRPGASRKVDAPKRRAVDEYDAAPLLAYARKRAAAGHGVAVRDAIKALRYPPGRRSEMALAAILRGAGYRSTRAGARRAHVWRLPANAR